VITGASALRPPATPTTPSVVKFEIALTDFAVFYSTMNFTCNFIINILLFQTRGADFWMIAW